MKNNTDTSLNYAENLLAEMPKGNARILIRNRIETSTGDKLEFWKNVYDLLDIAVPKKEVDPHFCCKLKP